MQAKPFFRLNYFWAINKHKKVSFFSLNEGIAAVQRVRARYHSESKAEAALLASSGVVAVEDPDTNGRTYLLKTVMRTLPDSLLA